MSSWNDEVHPHGEIRVLGPRTWMVTGSLPRSPLPRTMLIHRLDDGGLLLHSVVALDEPGMAKLESLGPPRVIVAPSSRHRSHVAAFKRRYPSAMVVAPAAARAKVAEVASVDASCEETLPALGVTCRAPRGCVKDELAYEIDLAPGRGLVACDLLFNLAHRGGLKGAILRMLGSTGGFKVPPIARLLLVRDREELRAWLRECAAIPDLRLISMAHGEPVTEDCAARLRAAADAL